MNAADRSLVEQKQRQLDTMLPQLEGDLWLVYCREGRDPAAWLVAGHPMVGESAFLFTKDGAKQAIVAGYDAMAIEGLEVFDRVTAYGLEGIAPALRQLLQQLAPRRVALNFSEEDFLADGLSYGMFLRLQRVVREAGIDVSYTSAASVLSRLRALKSPEEVRRIREAIDITSRVFGEVRGAARPGMTERELCAFIEERQRAYGVRSVGDHGAAVCTGRIGIGHRGPGEHPLVPGDVVSIDMGVYKDGYCSDFTRTLYVLKAGEERPPDRFTERFAVARDAIQQAVKCMAPGVQGHEVDAVARRHLERCGVEAYPHALGHQIGRHVHDGAGALAPLVPRYGDRGRVVLEPGHVFTVEPFIYGRTEVAGLTPIGLEENVVVTAEGAEYLTTPQEALWCVC